MSHRLEIAPLADIRCNGRGWYECTGASGVLQLGGDSAATCGGWVLLQLKIGRIDLPLQFVAHPVSTETNGSGGCVLQRVGQRRLQGLMHLPAGSDGIRLEVIGGPAYLRIKKATLRILAGGSLFGLPGIPAAMDAVSRGLNAWSDRRRQARRKKKRSPALLTQDEYAAWIERFDTLHSDEIEAIRADISRLEAAAGGPPLLSVVMPVYDVEERWLRLAIASVRDQLYPHWQLCIADDASPSEHVRRVLDEARAEDARISVIYRKENGGIAAASNGALELAHGSFIALMDHDDTLPVHALYMVAAELAAHPETDILYSDEDKIDTAGRRYDPHFKPDWNLALLLSQNYVNHLTVYRGTLVAAAGGFRPGFDGAQDHDLLLRCSEQTSPDRIRHVAAVLYHWRAIPGSAARDVAYKPRAWEAGRRAIGEHLQRRGLRAEVQREFEQYYKVVYALPQPVPSVSIIVPTTARPDLLRLCLSSLLTETRYADFEVLVAVDENNAAIPERRQLLDEFSRDPKVRVLTYPPAPFNYSRVNNRAARSAHGTLLCLLNDDIQVTNPDWLEVMVSRACLDGVGAVGAMLYYPDGRMQHAGVIIGSGGTANHAHHGLPRGSGGYFARAALEQDLSAVTAACLVVRREVFEALGGLDEGFEVAFNDVDFCLRVRRAGWRIRWAPQAELLHHESASVGPPTSPARAEQFAGEVARMRQLWGELLDDEPFYNPNLSLGATAMFTLASPPRRRPAWRRAVDAGDAAR
ncbi:MAG: glycosyltransferase [Rhodospirillales bacterium]